MKTVKSICFCLILWGLNSTFLSCEDKISGTETYMANVPIYMEMSEFRAEKTVQSARKLEHPGKICMYGSYLFINEISKGIHIIDNTNPADPKNIGFLEIIGNIEMAVINDRLFADSYQDLVCFDLSNPAQISTVSRTEDAFPYVIPPTDNSYPIDDIDVKKGIVIGWEVKEVVKDKEFQKTGPIIYYEFFNATASNSWKMAGSSSTSKPMAITGSMARFAVNGDFLYTVSKNNNLLNIFRLTGDKANFVKDCFVSSNIETVFSYNNMLFFGTPNGMDIFSIEQPLKPTFVSRMQHVWGCDPVVVQGNYAYLTIRSGNLCGQGSSLLDVIDISNPKSPSLIGSFPMEEPYGLSIDGTRLFVCDKGLKVFDATDPKTLGSRLLKSFSSMHGYDVISYNNLLMLIGNDGLYQYDYSDSNNVRLLSTILINK